MRPTPAYAKLAVILAVLSGTAGCSMLTPPAGDAQTTVIMQGPGNATILTTDNPRVSRTFTFGEKRRGNEPNQLPIERR